MSEDTEEEEPKRWHRRPRRAPAAPRDTDPEEREWLAWLAETLDPWANPSLNAKRVRVLLGQLQVKRLYRENDREALGLALKMKHLLGE